MHFKQHEGFFVQGNEVGSERGGIVLRTLHPPGCFWLGAGGSHDRPGDWPVPKLAIPHYPELRGPAEAKIGRLVDLTSDATSQNCLMALHEGMRRQGVHQSLMVARARVTSLFRSTECTKASLPWSHAGGRYELPRMLYLGNTARDLTGQVSVASTLSMTLHTPSVLVALLLVRLLTLFLNG